MPDEPGYTRRPRSTSGPGRSLGQATLRQTFACKVTTGIRADVEIARLLGPKQPQWITR